MKARKCECCGAPLKGARCEYCGTEYAEEESLSIDHAVIEGDGFNVKIDGLRKMTKKTNENAEVIEVYTEDGRLIDFKKLENWEI